MKKIIVLIMVMALLLSGCAFLKTAQDFICQPTEAQKAEAAQWLAAMDSAQVVAASFYPLVGIAKASAVMTTIAQGGCFFVTELEKALLLLEEAQEKQVLAKGLKISPTPIVLQFPELWAAVAKSRK